jgi:uncharacterized protein (DUF58 family)
MKLRKGTYVLIKTALFLLITGILFTSYELLVLSAFPILLLLTPTLPVRVVVEESGIEGGEYVGMEFSAHISMKAKGFGVVKVMHKLPEHFELSEGSNAVARFVIGTSTLKINYKAIPTKRGQYGLDKVVVQVENPFLTGKMFLRELSIPLSLEVKQKIPKLIKIGVHRGIAKSPTPDVDVSKIGVPGTDFREIREYITGDPVKFINWKASARKNEILVNQYEVEGKKSVWIFLDANPYMRYGKIIRNYFEAGVEAVNALSYYYTQRGYRVGIYLVGYRKYIYPDTGRRQFRRISNELIKIEPSENYESLEEAIENSRALLITYKPLIYFITRLEHSRPVKAVMKATKFSRKTRRAPVEVIALTQEEETESEISVIALKTLKKSVESRLRAGGVRMVDWDIHQPLSQVLMKEVLFG